MATLEFQLFDVQKQIDSTNAQLQRLSDLAKAESIRTSTAPRYTVNGVQEILKGIGPLEEQLAKLEAFKKSIADTLDLEKLHTKTIPNNTIPGEPLVSTGQAKQIPIIPIAAGVGILILIVALTKRRKRK